MVSYIEKLGLCSETMVVILIGKVFDYDFIDYFGHHKISSLNKLNII